MRLLRPVATVLLAGAIVSSAAASTGPETTTPNLFIHVNVTLSDKKIVVYPRRAPRGTDVQFTIRNVGKRVHTFTLGTTRRGLGFQTGFSRALKPGKRQVLLLYLSYRGVLPYFSNMPADRKNPAMRGKFVVGPAVGGFGH